MAKRWSEEDDDLDIDLEFDRVEYMKKEIQKGKSTLVAVAIAPIFAFVTMYVFTLTEVWQISLVTGMLGLIFLKPMYDIFDIDIDKIGKKGWIKNGGVYFLTLLAVWIILMNPPFADHADPQLNELRIEVYEDGQWISQDEANITSGESYRIRIIAEITDNVAVDEDSVTLEFDEKPWEGPMDYPGNHLYEFEPSENGEEVQVETGSYSVTIRMEDVNGNRNLVETGFTLGEQ
ncbi:MAG: hypothetical protein ACOCSJ_02980 [Candidatus Natronoplasma sp.]